MTFKNQPRSILVISKNLLWLIQSFVDGYHLVVVLFSRVNALVVDRDVLGFDLSGLHWCRFTEWDKSTTVVASDW